MHLNLNPNSFNHNNNLQQKYRARALSASQSPPPVPPQPNRFIQFNEPNILGSQYYRRETPSIDIPEPPPRRYHLVPIRDENIRNNNNNQSPIGTQQNLLSFGRSSLNNNARHNDYENTRDIVRPPVVVKDPRRKPYYYNELSQSLDANDNNIDIPNTNLELMKSGDETTVHNSTLGSGDSLDNII